MRPDRARLMELLSTNDHYLLSLMLEEMEKQTALLVKIAGVTDKVTESVTEEVEKPRMGRPRKVEG